MMFEFAELDHRVEKTAYRRVEPKLREALLNAQYELKENGKFCALILIANNKYYARIKVLRTLCNALESAVDKL